MALCRKTNSSDVRSSGLALTCHGKLLESLGTATVPTSQRGSGRPLALRLGKHQTFQNKIQSAERRPSLLQKHTPCKGYDHSRLCSWALSHRETSVLAFSTQFLFSIKYFPLIEYLKTLSALERARTDSGRKVTQCQGPVNTSNATLSLHPPRVCTGPQRNTACQVNRRSADTCVETLVCARRACLKTLSLVAR